MRHRHNLNGKKPPSRGRPVRAPKNVGRNQPCPCGSGKKFKKCHGRPVSVGINPYKSFQATYSEDMRSNERKFFRQWGIVPTPSILAAYAEGDDVTVREWIRKRLTSAGCKPTYVEGIMALDRLCLRENVSLWTEEEKQTYVEELSKYCPPEEPVA